MGLLWTLCVECCGRYLLCIRSGSLWLCSQAGAELFFDGVDLSLTECVARWQAITSCTHPQTNALRTNRQPPRTDRQTHRIDREYTGPRGLSSMGLMGPGSMARPQRALRPNKPEPKWYLDPNRAWAQMDFGPKCAGAFGRPTWAGPNGRGPVCSCR